ncbi:MAG: fatty acid desaturase [Pirellulales bacterium]
MATTEAPEIPNEPEAAAPVLDKRPTTIHPVRINWVYAGTIAAIHVAALLAVVPYFFSWTGLIVMLVGIHVFGQGITIGYHRLLTHRSFKTPKWVERCFAILGMCCMEDTPVRWVTTHRVHHVHSDEIPDPHSPIVNFLWSHMGWLMVQNSATHSLAASDKFAKDLLRDPFYLYLERRPFYQLVYPALQLPIYFLPGFLYGWSTEGINAGVQLGLSLIVWGVLVRTVAVWHITWSVNSLSHMFGYQNYETGELSKNNWFVAILSVGEGWHNNHHEDPSAASVQHRWWEIDISYYEIKLLEKLGLAWDVIPPRHVRHTAKPKRVPK